MTLNVAFEFGEGIGEITFEDVFSLTQGPPFPDVGAFFTYLSCLCAGFEFGLTGLAFIGQPGTFDILTTVPISGDTITVPYFLTIDSFDVPLPPAAWLLGSGLVAMLAARRRR